MANEVDRVIGQNVVTLRGETSQKALADAMRERGHKWSQSTVWSVEKGDRPLKLAEAKDLAKVLQTNVDRLLAPNRSVSLARTMEHKFVLLDEKTKLLGNVSETFERTRQDLLWYIQKATEQGYESEVRSYTPYAEATAIEVVAPRVEEVASEFERRKAERPRAGPWYSLGGEV